MSTRPTHEFYSDCLHWAQGRVEHLEAIVNSGRDCSYETIKKRIGAQAMTDLESDLGYGPNTVPRHLNDDYAVTFHWTRYKGMTIYYVRHSAIEYVYLPVKRPPHRPGNPFHAI